MDFMGIGGGELLLILLVVLLVFGPKKLPEIGRTLGAATKKIKQASSQFAKDMSQEMKETGELKKEVSGLVNKELIRLDEEFVLKDQDKRIGQFDGE